jgi:RimJ/RimL family protein N-acetyltransferase
MPEIPFPDPPLRAEAIWLRPWMRADVPAIVLGCSDRAVAKFMPAIPSPYTAHDALAWLDAQEPKRLAGTSLDLAIAAGEGGEVLGAVGAVLNNRAMSAHVGYWITADARGNGHATAALRLLCSWLFHAFELGRIELTTDPENFASQQVAKRCGFQQEGLLRSHLRRIETGERRDSLVWGLLPGELTTG